MRGILGDEPKVEEEQKKNTKKEEVKCQGWIVLGFPKTAEEAEELEREMAGFIDSRHLPPSTADRKKCESLIIASPSGRTIRRPVLEKSLFDLIFKLEVPSQTLVRRAVDRRVDASGNVYNLTFNPPPDNLLPKLKPIENPNEEEILRNYEEFNADKARLNLWMQKFGVARWSSFVQIHETKLEVVKETIEKKIQEWLKNREENMNKVETFEVSLEFHDVEAMVSVQDVKNLYNSWVLLKNSYISDLLQALNGISNIKNELYEARQELLDTFEEFLTRPDQKQDLIDPFIEKLGKLLESKAIISSRSRKNLYDELDNLSDQLWDIIEGRKSENLKYLEKLINQDPCLALMTSVLSNIKSLVSLEISKLIRSFNLINLFNSILSKGEKPFIELGIPEVQIEINLENPDQGEEKLLEILRNGRNFIKTLPNSEVKDEGCSQFLVRLEEIQHWGKQTLSDIVKSSKKIFELLDKWIGDAIKAENDAANEIIKAWKDSVRDRRVSQVKTIRENSIIKEYLTRDLI
jgi:adenylate kinase family enzyme